MSSNPTRERILSATRTLIDQQGGSSGITVGAVAAASHVSRATLYRYFPDKATLLRAAGAADAHAVGRATPRERILEATIEVLGERGIHAATLEEIASRAGLTRSGLQWHYRNKEELLADLVQYVPLLSLLTDEAAQAAQPGANLESQLAHIAAVLLQQSGKLRGVLRFILFEASIYPEVGRLVSVYSIGRGLPQLVRIFEQHERSGKLRPGTAQVRAQAFMGLFMSLVLWRSAFGHLLAPDDDATAQEYLDILLHGIVAAPQEG